MILAVENWNVTGHSIIHGKKQSPDEEAVLKFSAELKKKLDDLSLKDKQVHNADKVAFYWKLLLNRTQIVRAI